MKLCICSPLMAKHRQSFYIFTFTLHFFSALDLSCTILQPKVLTVFLNGSTQWEHHMHRDVLWDCLILTYFYVNTKEVCSCQFQKNLLTILFLRAERWWRGVRYSLRIRPSVLCSMWNSAFLVFHIQQGHTQGKSMPFQVQTKTFSG
jgi:hypothetical protein